MLISWRRFLNLNLTRWEEPLSVLFGILCPPQPSKLFNEVVWARALPITRSDLITHWRQMSVAAPGVSCGQLGCLFWTVSTGAGSHREQTTRTLWQQPATALPSVTLGPEPELRCGAQSSRSWIERGYRVPGPAGASEVSVTSVRGLVLWTVQCQASSGDSPGGEGSPSLLPGEGVVCTVHHWPGVVDCCCCCPLSPSKPLWTRLSLYAIQPS